MAAAEITFTISRFLYPILFRSSPYQSYPSDKASEGWLSEQDDLCSRIISLGYSSMVDKRRPGYPTREGSQVRLDQGVYSLPVQTHATYHIVFVDLLPLTLKTSGNSTIKSQSLSRKQNHNAIWIGARFDCIILKVTDNFETVECSAVS